MDHPATPRTRRRREKCYQPWLAVGSQDSMVPFHKLCQWLTYSLIEPFEAFGIEFVDNYLLTGLAEYRNGGLFVDSGVLVPRGVHLPHHRGGRAARPRGGGGARLQLPLRRPHPEKHPPHRPRGEPSE